MNGIELFERIKQVSTFDELLQFVNGKTKAETQSKRGNLFEKVWDIIIKFGFYSILPNDIYDHYEGNINTCKIKKVSDLEIYLRGISVFSKGKGGSSDITLQNKNNGKWVFMSSKFYLDDSKKSIDNYDVEKILAIVKQHSHKYKEYDIYLVVNNKQKVMNTITSSQATNNYIKENIHHILDLEDLEICFQNLKHSIQDITINEVNSKFCNEKVPLQQRFHQDLITYKQMERIDEGEKELLLGAKARSGKTYCVGGLFIKYHKKYLSLNGLIITPAPTETLSQFTDDLFHKFIDFNGINIVEIKKGTDFETMVLQENNIIIVSKQLLDDYVCEKKVEAIQQLNLDFIVFDENHFHGTTLMSKNILQSYSSSKTIKLYLTATYAKPLSEWNIPLECQFYWDIEDEQLCKKRDIQGLVEKHGDDVLLFLNEENKEQLLKIYDKMPDLHISRVLNTCLDYNVYKKDLNVEQKISYLVENNLINIDSDLFQGKGNNTKLVEKLLHIWKADPIHNLKILLKKIEESIIDMDTKDQKMMNQYFTSSINNEKVNIKVQFDEESEDALPTGKETIKQDGGEKDVDGKEDDTDIDISLTKDVLPFIIPLICILTMNTEHKDILEMLNVIKTSPVLLSVFQDQSFIWWNKPDIIRLIEVIVGKYIRKNSCIYNISIQFKMSLQSLIDKPKELLELIDSCLKPKQKEKQENGEVFTPMCLVFEMLDNLDKHYIKEHGRSIFTEPSFKWFDPASGMGNFPVAVYFKLIEGLKTQIPNDEDRKKHIIENMLYMSELNKKNVFISHQIFNMNNQYKLNLYEGDTLELDIVSVWGLELNSFDVILGNPPYNKGGIRSHTGKQLGEKNETIWTKFIEKSSRWLKPYGFLVFINPLSWLKKSHSLHNEMLEKHIVWLKLWDDSQSKGMINADIPISLYVLQNTLNTQNKKTEIISEIKRKKLTTTSFEYLNKNYSIPLAFHSIFDKLIQFIEKHNCSLEYKTKTIKSSGTKAKIPTEYTLEDMWAIDTYTLNEGILVKKATEQHPDANKRKLIIANKRGFKGAFIDEGKLCLTGTEKFYMLGENLELILKIMNFGISNILCDYTKYRMSFLEKEVCNYIPDIRKLGLADITEDEFYKLIGLTCQEINQIKHPSSNINQIKNPSSNEVVEEDKMVIEIEVKQKVKKLKIVKPKKKLLIVEEETA